MAIEQKPKDKETAKAPAPQPLQFRNNPEVKRKIEAHKEANPGDFEYYSRLVREAPERAIETLIYKDVQRHENEMRLILKQLPQAREFYDNQKPDARARIDADLEGVHPYYRDKAFVSAALKENDRQLRKAFANPAEKPPAAEMDASGKVTPMPKPPAKVAV